MGTTTTMQAFHGDKKIKSKYLVRVRAHRKADDLIRGTGWDSDSGRGCAVGCTLEAYDHSRYPVELGIPVELARLEDRMFEGMPKAKAMAWPADFLSAIPVGADLSDVWPKFAMWLLKDVRKHARPDGKAAIDTVVGLYRERAPMTDPRWAKARSAAYAAYAAAAAAYAADASADAAAYAASAAASASASAADDASARKGAREGHFYRQSRQLLELLKRAPVRKATVK